MTVKTNANVRKTTPNDEQVWTRYIIIDRPITFILTFTHRYVLLFNHKVDTYLPSLGGWKAEST